MDFRPSVVLVSAQEFQVKRMKEFRLCILERIQQDVLQEGEATIKREEFPNYGGFDLIKAVADEFVREWNGKDLQSEYEYRLETPIEMLTYTSVTVVLCKKNR